MRIQREKVGRSPSQSNPRRNAQRTQEDDDGAHFGEMIWILSSFLRSNEQLTTGSSNICSLLFPSEMQRFLSFFFRANDTLLNKHTADPEHTQHTQEDDDGAHFRILSFLLLSDN